MIKNFMITSLFLLTSIYGIYAQPERWKSIKPIESNSTDIERILGKPKTDGYFVRYELEEGIYFINYSDGKCVTKWREEWNSSIPELPPLKEGTSLMDWNVPEWTVVEFSFSPNEDIPISSLGLNLKTLKKTNNSLDTPNLFSYVDKNNGISYKVQLSDELKVYIVTRIDIFPASKYNKLLCNKKNRS